MSAQLVKPYGLMRIYSDLNRARLGRQSHTIKNVIRHTGPPSVEIITSFLYFTNIVVI